MKEGESEYDDDDLDIKSELQDVFDRMKDTTVVGLRNIFELRRSDPDLPPVYQCFLCDSNIATGRLLVQHVLGTEHKLAFVKENDPKVHSLLLNVGVEISQLDSLIESFAAGLERKLGRGKIVVRKENPKAVSDNYCKRSSIEVKDDDDEDDDEDSHQASKRINSLPPKEYERGSIPKTVSQVSAGPATTSTNDSGVGMDSFMKMFMSLPPAVFYPIVLSKLESQETYTDSELSGLANVEKKAFDVVAEHKSRSMPANLKNKCRQVLQQSGVSFSDYEQFINSTKYPICEGSSSSSYTPSAPQSYSNKAAESTNAAGMNTLVEMVEKLLKGSPVSLNTNRPDLTPNTTNSVPVNTHLSDCNPYSNTLNAYPSHLMYSDHHQTSISKTLPVSYVTPNVTPNLSHQSYGQAAQQSAHALAQQSAHTLAQQSAHTLAQQSAHTLAQQGAHTLAQQGAHTLEQQDAHTLEQQDAHTLPNQTGNSVSRGNAWPHGNYKSGR